MASTGFLIILMFIQFSIFWRGIAFHVLRFVAIFDAFDGRKKKIVINMLEILEITIWLTINDLYNVLFNVPEYKQ